MKKWLLVPKFMPGIHPAAEIKMDRKHNSDTAIGGKIRAVRSREESKTTRLWCPINENNFIYSIFRQIAINLQISNI